MNDEVRQSRSIKMKPSIVRKAHLKAIEQGKTLGRWIEDAHRGEDSREGRHDCNRGQHPPSRWQVVCVLTQSEDYYYCHPSCFWSVL